MSTLEHLNKFLPHDLLVFEGENWLVTVRAKQVTFGSTVVLPKRIIPTFADVTSNEASELFQILARLEKVATSLGAEKVNVVAAMMKDPFVHFHFFPRYSKPKTELEETWTDEDWPRAVTLRNVDTAPEALVSLRALISQEIADQ